MDTEPVLVKAWSCRLDKSGRIVLPIEMRTAKHLDYGDELIASFEGGAIVLRTYEDAMQRLQDAFCSGIDPDISLVDELIADRRLDATLD